ncbi:hypothetical protein MKEN_00587300 [Mycena kentingensis (nom. inval.)]|nr:hypothetical protein MKEN_00587300 [Mycena kentingensis (nom. inval.)]
MTAAQQDVVTITPHLLLPPTIYPLPKQNPVHFAKDIPGRSRFYCRRRVYSPLAPTRRAARTPRCIPPIYCRLGFAAGGERPAHTCQQHGSAFSALHPQCSCFAAGGEIPPPSLMESTAARGRATSSPAPTNLPPEAANVTTLRRVKQIPQRYPAALQPVPPPHPMHFDVNAFKMRPAGLELGWEREDRTGWYAQRVLLPEASIQPSRQPDGGAYSRAASCQSTAVWVLPPEANVQPTHVNNTAARSPRCTPSAPVSPEAKFPALAHGVDRSARTCYVVTCTDEFAAGGSECHDLAARQADTSALPGCIAARAAAASHAYARSNRTITIPPTPVLAYFDVNAFKMRPAGLELGWEREDRTGWYAQRVERHRATRSPSPPAFVWCGFQTGNFAQLALAVARILGTTNPADRVLLPADILALTSLLAFNFGAFTGGRIGDRIGAQTRVWLVSGTLLQAALTFGAGLCVQLSGEGSVSAGRGTPAWTSLLSSVAMGLMAASLGVQGVIGKRLGTNLSTTVVPTALWIELVADPHLFKSPTRRIASRDHRALALFVLFGGAIIARLMLGQVGAAATLGFATGLRMLIAASWLFVKGKGEGYVRLWDEQEADADALAEQTANYGTVVP